MWGNMRDFLKIGCINNDLRHELMGPIDMSKSDRHNGSANRLASVAPALPTPGAAFGAIDFAIVLAATKYNIMLLGLYPTLAMSV
jgi:hypothetical protein